MMHVSANEKAVSLNVHRYSAVMAAIESADIQSLGFKFIVYPTLIGSLFIVFMGRITVFLKRKYEFNLAPKVALWIGGGACLSFVFLGLHAHVFGF
jgi:hypothetical protein